LRVRAERALEIGERGREVFDVLDTLVRGADRGSDDALFAHRQLAELRLEESPWVAALHLRELLRAGVDDHSIHALMGLCMALLGNFRAAVGAYRKALARAPNNPWYHHNLGHLLDVGLGDSDVAVNHLRRAHELRGNEDEITASLAHCLARVGETAEARALADEVGCKIPEPRERGSGVSAKEGAREDADVDALDDVDAREELERRVTTARSRGAAAGAIGERVARVLSAQMRQAGADRDRVARALGLWADYCGACGLNAGRAEVYAAAVEYALARLDRTTGVTQAALARRYGVTVGSVANRYGAIRNALALEPDDPRYV
jgi:hypothetical protein